VSAAVAHSIAPVPTDEEAAAISVAIEHLWPRATVVLPQLAAPRSLGWRFSGRWWSRPGPVSRVRPWL